ncbi:MAG: sugar phosphate isomerase/epimerase [bacterium]
MIVICTPCRASKEKDVATRVDLLKGLRDFDHIERYRHLCVSTGLEIVGPLDNFVTVSKADDTIKNLEAARKEISLQRIVVHAPVTRDNYEAAPTNLSRPESVEILNEVFALASRIGASLVNVHAETLMSHAEMEGLTDRDRLQLLSEVAGNLSRVKKQGVGLAIENMPVPLMGDTFFSSNDMVYDPLFADPLEIRGFVKKNGFLMTFDTCHWGTLSAQGNLVNVYKQVQDVTPHIHMSDVWGIWREGTCRFREGLIPGEGNIGEENFIELVRYINASSQEISATVEVIDSDFMNPTESRSALIAIHAWVTRGPGMI